MKISTIALLGILAVCLLVLLAGTPDEPYTGAYTDYTICPGDTLWSIACEIESDEPIESLVHTIRKDNNIKDCGSLQIGEQIKIREVY